MEGTNIAMGYLLTAGRGKRYGGFPWEIKRKNLKHFPVIFDFDKKYRFLGLTILK
jgi:hypothetical protein